MSGYNPYGDGTGYGNMNSMSSGGHLDGHNAGGFSENHGSQQTKQNYLRQYIVPVTIKMLNDASTEGGSDGTFQSHGVELSYVRFIGVIREVDSQNSSYLAYKIEDGTDSVSFRYWNNQNSDSQNNNNGFDDFNEDAGNNFSEPEFSINDYVEVVATVREFNNKIQLQAQSMKKIKDFNQVPYHLLNVSVHYLTVRNGGTLPSNNFGNNNTENKNSLFVSDEQINQNTPIKDRVFAFIKDNAQTMSDGVPIKFIVHELGLDHDEAVKIFTDLMDCGLIFASTDDDNFLPL